MKKLLVFAVLISAATLAGFWGARKVCLMMEWPGTISPTTRWVSTLGLSAEQAAGLKEKESAFRKEANSLCMQVCQGRLEVLEMMEKKGAAGEEVLRKVGDVGALQIDLEKKVADHILEVKKSLTHHQSEIYLAHIREQVLKSIRQCGISEAMGQ